MTATEALNRQKAKQAAQIAIVEARQACPVKHYGELARRLPVQLRQHGLGQMLAYMHGRGKGRDSSPFEVLARQIERHVADVLPIRAGDLKTLTANDSRLYLQATRQVEMFLVELGPFVEKFA